MRVQALLLLTAVVSLALTACLRSLMTGAGVPIANWHWFALACSLPGALTLGALLRERAYPDTYLICLGFVAVFVVLAGAPWCSRDYFLADFERVRPGMAERQVEAALGKYLKGGRYLDTLRPTRALTPGEVPTQAEPRVPLCQSYGHSREPAWNGDWGTVCYRDGLVVSASFVPD